MYIILVCVICFCKIEAYFGPSVYLQLLVEYLSRLLRHDYHLAIDDLRVSKNFLQYRNYRTKSRQILKLSLELYNNLNIIKPDIYISDIIFEITFIGSDSFAVVLVFKFVRCLKRRLTLSYIMSEPSFTLTLCKCFFSLVLFQQTYENIDKIIIAFKDISLFHYSYIRPFNKRRSWRVWTFTVGNIGVIGIIFQ